MDDHGKKIVIVFLLLCFGGACWMLLLTEEPVGQPVPLHMGDSREVVAVFPADKVVLVREGGEVRLKILPKYCPLPPEVGAKKIRFVWEDKTRKCEWE